MRYILLLLVLLVSSFSYAQEDSESVDTENIEEVVTSADVTTSSIFSVSTDSESS